MYVAHSSDFHGPLRFSCRFGCRLALLSNGSSRNAISLGALVATSFLVCFTPVGRSTALIGAQEKTPAGEIRSVSGRIGSIGDAEFDLNKKEPEKRKFIDSETKMEAIGTNAAVDYRSSDGKNIAARVIVVPVSGLRPG